MRPQTLAYTRVISDMEALAAARSDLLPLVTQDVTRRMGEEVEGFITDHGPCIVSRITVTERPNHDPLMRGNTHVWKQDIMPIAGATDEDWQDMRRRCSLEP